MAYPQARNGNMVHRSSSPGTLRVIGLLLALASMILAALAAFFFLQGIAARLLAVIVLLLAARVFALWLGARHSAEVAPHRVMGQPWIPTSPVPEQPRTPLSPASDSPPWLSSPPMSEQARIPASPTPDLPWAAATPTPEQASPVKSGTLLPESWPPAAAHAQAAANSGREVPRARPSSAFARPALSSYNAVSPAQSAFTAREEPREPHIPPAAPHSDYVPIDQDPLFQLDQPMAGERCFLLPKESEPLVECQDRYALRVTAGYRCYAVADGVAGSFVPGPWARIVAQSFVERAGHFARKDEFLVWQAECSLQWRDWIARRWVPTINALRARNGDRPGDWSHEIRTGAQTTLVGCTLLNPQQPESDATTMVNIFAIGDGELFLFRQAQGGWYVENMFPFDNAREFDAHPDTLVTAERPDLVERAWARHKTLSIEAHSGDVLVLTSDTLAKWLLTQIERHTDRWQPLLSITDAGEFERYIRREFHHDQVEDDDLTMLIIPV